MTEELKIFVIDDSEDDRMLYRRALQKTNAHYAISEADDGEEGLTRIGEEQPDCVLLDYSMPGRDGIEVLKRIRARHPFVPVVMLTGQGNEKIAVTAMQEGAQNYIAKSTITPEAIERVIRVAIEHCGLEKRIHEQRTALEIFTRALAHDLKEPVRTITSFLDLLAAHEPLSEKGQGYFHYIQNAANRMHLLIDTVYLYTRLDGGPQSPAVEECDVARIIEEVKENLGQLIGERRAVITCDSMPQVRANRVQLLQVLQNLICNAIKHCEVAPAIHVHAEEAGDNWRFHVSDNGPGIREEYHEKIFEPFKRMSSPDAQGLGLGLAICKKIIESHGGKIRYESRAGVGTTFLFTLPKIQAGKTAETRLSTGLPLSEGAPRAAGQPLAGILLVEDNEADIELLKIMLIERSKLRCNLQIARDGHQALDALHNSTPDAKPVDLILLDVNMPGMDGFEVLKHLREESTLRRIPVVMCSTSTYDKDIERAKSLGAAGYMNKPAEMEKLKTMIERFDTLWLQPEGDGYALLRAA